MFNFFGSKEVRYATRSPKWRSARSQHIKNQSSCMACGTKKELEVHHIIPVHMAPELELDLYNLITLCDRCHLLIGHLNDYQSWNEDVVKDSAKLLEKIKNRPHKLDNSRYDAIIDKVMTS